MDPQQLAVDYVERFNASVTAGDFTPLVESLADEAVMAFEGVNIGPYKGKSAIAEAYRQSPPDDTIEVIEVRQTDPVGAVVEYAWHSDPARKPGQMRLRWGADGRLQTLEIQLP